MIALIFDPNFIFDWWFWLGLTCIASIVGILIFRIIGKGRDK